MCVFLVCRVVSENLNFSSYFRLFLRGFRVFECVFACFVQEPTRSDILLDVKAIGVRLRFEPRSQRLKLV